MNVPAGVITIIGFIVFMHEKVEYSPNALDYAGAALFSIAISAVLLAMTHSATLSWTEISLLMVVFAFSGAAFLLQERRITEPMIALDLWGDCMIARANGSLLLGTMTLIGITSYVPVYMQAVQGRSAITAGIPLSAMLFAWPLASTFSSRILKHLSMRTTLRTGAILMPIGTALLLLV